MRSEEPDPQTPLVSESHIPSGSTDPMIRARNLFARHSAEFAMWDSVGSLLDTRSTTPSPPDAIQSYARLHARMAAEYPDNNGVPQIGAEKYTSSQTAPSFSRAPGFLVRYRSMARWMIPVAAMAVAAFFFVDRSSSAHRSAVTYATRNAERTEVTLSDGTTVMLNVGSRLEVPSEFGESSRTLFLEGEAQFTVQHMPALPFVVHAGNTVVRDLATRFVIRAYRDVGRTVVAVAEGRVAVQASTLRQPSSAVLEPGEVATITLDQGMDVGMQRSDTEFFGWTSGDLIFNHVPISEALAQTGRWYDIEFQVNDPSLLTSDLTFTFRGHLLTDKQLSDLGDVLGARVERHGRTVTLTPVSYFPSTDRQQLTQ